MNSMLYYIIFLLSYLNLSKSFYLYDRFNNKPVIYDITDSSNIFYTSNNFHSIDYVNIGLRNVNITKNKK
jgi:hypothetical protein